MIHAFKDDIFSGKKRKFEYNDYIDVNGPPKKKRKVDDDNLEEDDTFYIDESDGVIHHDKRKYVIMDDNKLVEVVDEIDSQNEEIKDVYTLPKHMSIDINNDYRITLLRTKNSKEPIIEEAIQLLHDGLPCIDKIVIYALCKTSPLYSMTTKGTETVKKPGRIYSMHKVRAPDKMKNKVKGESEELTKARQVLDVVNEEPFMLISIDNETNKVNGALIYRYIYTFGIAELLLMAVDKNTRGKGIGRELVRQLKTNLPNMITRIIVKSDNYCVKFYQKQYFKSPINMAPSVQNMMFKTTCSIGMEWTKSWELEMMLKRQIGIHERLMF
jgi:ribosomal protein S18 acetylase RimI-like enzyme